MSEAAVYRIVNTVSDTTYIGSSSDATKRLIDHRSALRRGAHDNTHLQRAWNQYGHAAFTFEPLVECQLDDLSRREQVFMDAYRDHDMKLYNLRPSAESRTGHRVIFSAEHCARISAAKKGAPISAETRAKLSVALLGCKRSASTRAKMRSAKKGCRFSDEARAKMSASQKLRVVSVETRAKISAAMKGRVFSVEALANMRAAWLRRKGIS